METKFKKHIVLDIGLDPTIVHFYFQFINFSCDIATLVLDFQGPSSEPTVGMSYVRL